MLPSRRRSSRTALPLFVILSLAVGCATATTDGETTDDETMGDGDLGTGGAGDGDGDGDGTGGLVVVPGSGGGLIGSGGTASGGSSSGGSASGGTTGSGGTSSGGAGSGGAASGGAGSGGAPGGDMCDAPLWASGPQGTYEPGDHVTAVCDSSGLSNGHECYGKSGLYWFFCEGDNYQCSTFDPSGTVAHGVWQVSASPCP